jgi:1,4-dihydroxy-6-naphthoate synthase
MFDALVNNKIENTDINFDVQMEDVETLNRKAFNEELDVTKLSFAAFSKVSDKYEMLTAGSALGTGVGPLLICKKKFSDPVNQIKTIAVPGLNTTAYFLFRIFFPGEYIIREMVFSEIESALLNEVADAGIIIHENRFTYEAKGLHKITDLGEQWENLTGKPIPLGGIAIRRSIDKNIRQKINTLLRQSIEYALSYPDEASGYVKAHAQEMSEEVRKKHIDLYVNNYSLNIGKNGKEAIRLLFRYSGNVKIKNAGKLFTE